MSSRGAEWYLSLSGFENEDFSRTDDRFPFPAAPPGRCARPLGDAFAGDSATAGGMQISFRREQRRVAGTRAMGGAHPRQMETPPAVTLREFEEDNWSNTKGLLRGDARAPTSAFSTLACFASIFDDRFESGIPVESEFKRRQIKIQAETFRPWGELTIFLPAGHAARGFWRCPRLPSGSAPRQSTATQFEAPLSISSCSWPTGKELPEGSQTGW